MSRRIEIEITSLNGDVATWRAAGAKLPKGTLDAALIPGGPVVGTVYRADIDQFMERMEVIAVLPAKTASPLDPRKERIELIVADKKTPDVTVTYAPKGRGPRREGDRDRDRDGARGAGRGPKREGGPSERPKREGANGERGPKREGANGERGPKR